MPIFPRKENNVFALAYEMITGYSERPDIFIHADIDALLAAFDDYTVNRVADVQAQANYRQATETKNQRLRELVAVAREQLKRSEADCKDAPEKLDYIGWDTRRTPHKADAPGRPRTLALKSQPPDTVRLDWKTPVNGSGGAVRSYVIQRRQMPPEGNIAWRDCQAAVDTEAILYQQPRGADLEYRILAINAAGRSAPSNTAAVTL